MRIEGTYTFPASIEQVVSALTHPDILGQVIPGCERLAQLGPTAEDRPALYELRLRRGPGADVYSVTMMLDTTKAPTHLRADLDGRGPDGPFTGHGLVDLVQQDGHTVVASAWEVKSPVLAGKTGERRTAWNEAAEQFAGTVRDRAIKAMRGAATSAGDVRHLTTPRGRVVVLPRSSGQLPPALQVGLRRAIWIGGGMLVGLAAIGAFVAVARRLGGSADDAGDTRDS
jgi:carbon monoxide dehydrogenase subunit G